MPLDGKVFFTEFNHDPSKVRQLLEAAGLADRLSCYVQSSIGKPHRIIIKPNLVNASPPPITTPAWIVAELVDFLVGLSIPAEIIVADGTGEPGHSTLHLFGLHGYLELIGRDYPEVTFSDLNEEPTCWVPLQNGRRWQGLQLPEIMMDSFIISLPVLKAHTLAKVTLGMKNMIGVCPPEHYQQGGYWKKSVFHQDVHSAIFDLNMGCPPDFVLLDATVGMAEAHLGGPECDPPVNLLVAGHDPVAVDAFGAGLLGIPWQDVGHIRMAEGVLGSASSLQEIRID